MILAALSAALMAASSPERAAESWLRKNAVVLASTDPENQAQDLAVFGAIVGDANIAGFGEATHGSREFFLMKDRAFRYLVEHAGFTGFAIEGNFAAAEAIDRWVKGGEGDPEQLIAAMGFWTWDTEEVLGLVKWMRAYNADHANRLSFRGVDMQHAGPNLNIALDYLARHDRNGGFDPKPFANFLVAATNQRDGYRHMAQLHTSQGRALREAAEALVSHLEERRDVLQAASGTDAYLAALSGATAATWYFLMEGPRADRRFRNLKSGYDIRDRAMADLALLAHKRLGEHGRLFVWGHNAHVANNLFEGNRMTMGQFLKQELGPEYVSVGFAFDRGRFQAFPPADPAKPDFKPSLSVMEAGAAPGDHSEAMLRRVPAQLWAADLRTLPRASPAYLWFATPRQLRWTGANYSLDLMAKHKPISLTEHFDALVFVAETSRARPLKNTRDKQAVVKDW